MQSNPFENLNPEDWPIAEQSVEKYSTNFILDGPIRLKVTFVQRSIPLIIVNIQSFLLDYRKPLSHTLQWIPASLQKLFEAEYRGNTTPETIKLFALDQIDQRFGNTAKKRIELMQHYFSRKIKNENYKTIEYTQNKAFLCSMIPHEKPKVIHIPDVVFWMKLMSSLDDKGYSSILIPSIISAHEMLESLEQQKKLAEELNIDFLEWDRAYHIEENTP